MTIVILDDDGKEVGRLDPSRLESRVIDGIIAYMKQEVEALAFKGELRT